MNDLHEFLTVKEFAALVRVHYSTVMRAIQKGRLNAFRMGEGKRAVYRIPRSEIQRIALIDMEKMINKIIDDRLI